MILIYFYINLISILIINLFKIPFNVDIYQVLPLFILAVISIFHFSAFSKFAVILWLMYEVCFRYDKTKIASRSKIQLFWDSFNARVTDNFLIYGLFFGEKVRFWMFRLKWYLNCRFDMCQPTAAFRPRPPSYLLNPGKSRSDRKGNRYMGSWLYFWLINWWYANVSRLKLNWSIISDTEMFRPINGRSKIDIFEKSKIFRNEISRYKLIRYYIKKILGKT